MQFFTRQKKKNLECDDSVKRKKKTKKKKENPPKIDAGIV